MITEGVPHQGSSQTTWTVARSLTPAWRDDINPTQVHLKPAKRAAAGFPAVAVALQRSVEQMGVGRSLRTLRRLNQVEGFDCMGCAWPDPDPEHRSFAEFCENGTKAVAEEATLRRVDAAFFA